MIDLRGRGGGLGGIGRRQSNEAISDETKCFNKEDRSEVDQTSMSLQLLDALDTKEFPNTLNKIQSSSVGRYDVLISESNAIRQFKHSSWKYKNPYSVSISDHTRYRKSNQDSEDTLKEDEPQEGRVKRSVFSNCREYLVNYQESCGTPRTEYSFAALIIIMAQTTARSLWALIYVIVNVASIIQMFAFILRFVLDKIINIYKTKNFQQVIMKFTIFAVQLLSVYVCLTFILGFIVLPIVQMAVGIATKLVIRN